MNKFHLFVVVLCVGSGMLLWAIGQGWFAQNRQGASIDSPDAKEAAGTPISEEQSQAELAKILRVQPKDFIEAGGVNRPKRDLAFDANSPNVGNRSGRQNPGRAPFLKGNENTQVAGLMAELQQTDRREATASQSATSTYFLPEPFDQAKFDTDPKAYLTQIRPGRVFQPAQPDTETKSLEATSDRFASVLQGESMNLRVKADPGAPVTFHTQQTGTFENQLKTITVLANDEGIVEAPFTLGKGTSGLVNVLAASPVHSGQVKFTIKVSLPAPR